MLALLQNGLFPIAICLFLAALAPTPNAAPIAEPAAKVHRIALSLIQLPDWASKARAVGAQGQNAQQSRLQAAVGSDDGGSVGLTQTVGQYQTAFIGSVEVGEPAQQLSVAVDPWSQDFYFLTPPAGGDSSESVESSSNDSTVVYYDPAQSSSASVNSQAFYAHYGYVRGNTTVTDSVKFNGAQVFSLSAGLAATYPAWIASLPIAGVVGISPVSQHNGNLTSFASQLNGTSASAVGTTVSLYSNLTSVNATYFNAGSGQLTVGGEDEDNCVAGSYVYSPTGTHLSSGFRVDSISGVSASSGEAISLAVNTNRSMQLSDNSNGVMGTQQFIHLLINASGLVYNNATSAYELGSCDDLAQANDLILHVPSGETVVLSPKDYIFQTRGDDGAVKCVSNLYDVGIDESDVFFSTVPFVLPQFFLNNHCYAYNYAEGTLGIGSAKVQTLGTFDA